MLALLLFFLRVFWLSRVRSLANNDSVQSPDADCSSCCSATETLKPFCLVPPSEALLVSMKLTMLSAVRESPLTILWCCKLECGNAVESMTIEFGSLEDDDDDVIVSDKMNGGSSNNKLFWRLWWWSISLSSLLFCISLVTTTPSFGPGFKYRFWLYEQAAKERRICADSVCGGVMTKLRLEWDSLVVLSPMRLLLESSPSDRHWFGTLAEIATNLNNGKHEYENIGNCFDQIKKLRLELRRR